MDIQTELLQQREELTRAREKMAEFALEADNWYRKWQFCHNRLVRAELLLRELNNPKDSPEF